MVTAEHMVRFNPFAIPTESLSKHTFWFLFHQNRLRFTQVIVSSRIPYRVQGTAYKVRRSGVPDGGVGGVKHPGPEPQGAPRGKT